MATSGSGGSGSGTQDIAWQHGEPLTADKKKSRCKYCLKVLNSGGSTRLKQHLAGGYKDVSKCTKVPYEVQQAIAKNLKGGRQRKEEMVQKQREFEDTVLQRPFVDVDEESDDDEERRRAMGIESLAEWRQMKAAMVASRQSFHFENVRQYEQTRGAGGSGSGASLPPRHSFQGSERSERRRRKTVQYDATFDQDPSLFKHQDIYQRSIPYMFDGGKEGSREEEARLAISKFMFYNNIAANVAKTPYYQGMINAVARAGVGVKGPSAWELMNKYLPKVKQEVEEYIGSLKERWTTYGVTVMADGWTGPTRQSIINFMLSCNGKTSFLKSVDASDKIKDADYLYKLLRQVVLEVGPSNVIQIVTDNGANFKKAGEMLMKKKSSRIRLFWTPCAAHSIDLMLKDLGKRKSINTVVERARKVSNFIYNHGYVLKMMRNHCKGDLVRPGLTRFATNYVALKSFQKKVVGLRHMFASEEWFNWRGSSHPDAVMAQQSIADDSFWRQLNRTVGILKPIVFVLRMVDSEKKPTMPHIYAALQQMKELVRAAAPGSFKSYERIIDERWEGHLMHPLHLAAYYLNPKYHYKNELGLNVRLMSAMQDVVEKLVPDAVMQGTINGEIREFRDASGSFGKPSAVATRQKTDPADWWVLYGTTSPNLRDIAIKVLSQTCSSSGCERNWSTFSLIHGKVRNRLGSKRLEDLVYVHYNMRLRVGHIQDDMDDESQEPIELTYIFHKPPAEDEEDDVIYQWVRDRGGQVLDGPGGQPDPTIVAAWA